jgi:oxygen-independent coproporphyrinogen-3 oxidase
MDLIFATPNESHAQWEQDLETAIGLNPSHISTYELTWEKGTTFWNRLSKGELDGSEEDLRVSMYQHAIDRCDEAGLKQYEISSFASSGKRCRHNLQYWLCNPWFAFGPSAASFVGGVRRTNHRSPTTWMKRLFNGESEVAEVEELSARDRAIERLIFGLRMIEGIDISKFEMASKTTVESLVGKVLPSLASRGLISTDDGSLKLTEQGVMLADTVAAELL